jgi:PIN domain nuclease of toxin-antitoxin system
VPKYFLAIAGRKATDVAPARPYSTRREWSRLGDRDGGSGVTALALTTDVAAAAGSLPDAFPGDAVDRIAYATAVSAGAQLVTKDRRLRTFDPARTVW